MIPPCMPCMFLDYAPSMLHVFVYYFSCAFVYFSCIVVLYFSSVLSPVFFLRLVLLLYSFLPFFMYYYPLNISPVFACLFSSTMSPVFACLFSLLCVLFFNVLFVNVLFFNVLSVVFPYIIIRRFDYSQISLISYSACTWQLV